MDPTSTLTDFAEVIGIGLDVFQNIDHIIQGLDSGLNDLEDIHDRAADIEVLLLALQQTDSSAHRGTPQEVAYSQRLRDRAQKCLDVINAFVEKVEVAGIPEDNREKAQKITWMRSLEEYRETLQQMQDLEIVLGLMMTLMYSLCQPQVTPALDEVHVHVNALRRASGDSRQRFIDEPIPRSPDGRPHCPTNCNCTCHKPTFVQVIPKVLHPFVGQVFFPKRLLRPPWAPSRNCNVQTCRAELKSSMPVRWLLPASRVSAHLQLSLPPFPIYLTVSLPRLVARTAPIWRLVSNGEIEGVRNLFLAKQASVFDVTEGGGSPITHACRAWQQNPSAKNLEMIRFLVQAGADAGFSVSTSMSAKDYLVLMSYKFLLEQTGRGFANSVKTSSIAVEIFRSLLDMDLLDALQDYLDRRGLTQKHQILVGLDEDQTQDPLSALDRLEVFRSLTGFTPLEYSAILAPDQMLALIARGENASAGAPLCYALGWGHTDLIKPLLDAGADVNARDWKGMTALHYVCYYARYSSLVELAHWAEDSIDWDACTADGKNALRLLRESVALDELEPAQRNGFEAILNAHEGQVRVEEDEEEVDVSLKTPGAYPYSAVRHDQHSS